MGAEMGLAALAEAMVSWLPAPSLQGLAMAGMAALGAAALPRRRDDRD